LKILSLEKLIEQLRAEIKDKGNTITELEEKLKAQVKKYDVNKIIIFWQFNLIARILEFFNLFSILL